MPAAATTAASATTAGALAPTSARTTGTRTTGARRGSWAVALLVLLAVVLGLAGCGADATSSEEAAADRGAALDAPQPAEADGGAAGAAEDGAEGGAGGDAGAEAGVGEGDAADEALPGAGASGGTGRRVVTSSIDVAVEDVAAAAEQVRTLAVRSGGEVADESSQGGERPRAEIVLRVPADDTPGVLEEVAALGEEVARTADSEPVETRLVDLESRTATQRAGVERIRALLEQATTLEDVLALEAELTRRQADLESVDAQRAALADLARLATITVRLTTPEDVAAPERELPPFLQGLDAGWEALVASTTVVLVILGGILPFAVVAALVLAAAVPLLRALRRRRDARGPALGRTQGEPRTQAHGQVPHASQVPAMAADRHPAAQHPAPQHPAPQHPAPQHPAPQHPAPQHPAPQQQTAPTGPPPASGAPSGPPPSSGPPAP